MKSTFSLRNAMSESSIESSWTQADEPYESPLRPKKLTEFLGQKKVREKLDVLLGAAKMRKEQLGHCLFYGPPGLGKTTLAHIIAKSMGTSLTITSGPMLEKAADLAGMLTNLKRGDILFIDEIHRLNKTIEEYLYPAIEDFSLDLIVDSGAAARSVRINLEPFTLVGATTRAGLVSSPLRSRFGFTCRLDFYDHQTLSQILIRSASLLGIGLEEKGALEIAKRSRGTPRIANNLLRWVRDFAQMKKYQSIDETLAHEALMMLSIDEKGLDEMDKRILSILLKQFQGGPVGIQTLAVAIGEEADTVAEVYEPYLIMQGFLKRTPRGREATPLAYQHLKHSEII